MKIAIAVDGNKVSEHFGRCEKFLIFDIRNDETKNVEEVANFKHEPGFLPKLLKDFGVEVVITGGIGHRAKELLNSMKIEVIHGIKGDVDDVVEQYIKNNLEKIENKEELCECHFKGDADSRS
ncbi:MAG TPA: dinitrogenase iron-molybdenum cofactor [Candidatus Altiarchaeales archaeon]|nr:MAG: dinitrogenase iron-molybdenum cofactor [Candidatus Altiarchaeales archaeon]HDN83476.1 dinitrogenase iron-molybdenum cofactor [Candidatus Altiarchaeales archaeon]